jgi:hypothetical protein
MSRPRALLLVALAAAAIAWAYTSSAPARSAAVRAARTAQAARPAPPVFDLQVRAERLDGKASSATRPETRRNPFRFGEDVRAPRDPQPARPLTAPLAAEAPAAPVLPTLSLVGIVDRTVDGRAVRIAVLSTADGLVYVSAGDRIGTRYEVVSVSADAVELKDLTDGTPRRLALK